MTHDRKKCCNTGPGVCAIKLFWPTVCKRGMAYRVSLFYTASGYCALQYTRLSVQHGRSRDLTCVKVFVGLATEVYRKGRLNTVDLLALAS
jgi:hypothetical protein